MKKYNYCTPFLIMELPVVEDTLETFSRFFEPQKIFYAVKTNSSKRILKCIEKFGCSFDAASIYEIEKLISIGVNPNKINYGNTIKKAKDIEGACKLGIDKFTTDSLMDFKNIIIYAPAAEVTIRISMPDNMKSDWPLSKKFGCSKEEFREILEYANDFDVNLKALSFHVGSQQTDVNSFSNALASVNEYIEIANGCDIQFDAINLGGGMPALTITSNIKLSDYLAQLKAIITEYRRNNYKNIDFQIEPGRALVGDAGTIYAEIVLIKYIDGVRWIYLDVGKFGGLIETLGESIKYNIETEIDSNDCVETIIAGPTCDSEDILYEKYKYQLPKNLKAGDKLAFLSTGAYTRDYCSINFNGFPPLKAYIYVSDQEIYEEK